MRGKETFVLVALVTLTFAVTLALLWPNAPTPIAPRALPGRPAVTRAWWPALLAGPRASAEAAAAWLAPPARPAPPAPAPALEVPPSDDSGPPLPVWLRVSLVPAQNEDDEDGAPPTDRPALERQLDLFNDSGEPLQLIVLGVNALTGETTPAQVLVAPQSEAHVGSESGLKLEPGYQVSVRSRGFRELTQAVP
jgi:hypothetical protein